MKQKSLIPERLSEHRAEQREQRKQLLMETHRERGAALRGTMFAGLHLAAGGAEETPAATGA